MEASTITVQCYNQYVSNILSLTGYTPSATFPSKSSLLFIQMVLSYRTPRLLGLSQALKEGKVFRQVLL